MSSVKGGSAAKRRRRRVQANHRTRRVVVLEVNECYKLRLQKRLKCKTGEHHIVTSYDDFRISPVTAISYIGMDRRRDYRLVKGKFKDVLGDAWKLRGMDDKLFAMFPKRPATFDDVVGKEPELSALIKIHDNYVFEPLTFILKDYGPTVYHEGGTRRYHLCLVAIGVLWDIYIGLIETDKRQFKALPIFEEDRKERPHVVELKEYDDGRR